MGTYVQLLERRSTYPSTTFSKFQICAYSFVSFSVVALRMFIAFSSRHGESFLSAFHVTKHQWNMSPPDAQQPYASTLVVGSSLQLSIVEMLGRKFGNEWMLYLQQKHH